MNELNLTLKIPYVFMLLGGIAIVYTVFFSGLLTVDVSVDRANRQDFRRSIILENTLNVEASASELQDTFKFYRYERRRAIIPVEFFTNRTSSGAKIGFKKRNGHCYIPRVAGLDGRNYGIFIEPLYDVGKKADDPRELECDSAQNRENAVHSPAMLIRKAKGNPPLPVRIYVYEIS